MPGPYRLRVVPYYTADKIHAPWAFDTGIDLDEARINNEVEGCIARDPLREYQDFEDRVFMITSYVIGDIIAALDDQVPLPKEWSRSSLVVMKSSPLFQAISAAVTTQLKAAGAL